MLWKVLRQKKASFESHQSALEKLKYLLKIKKIPERIEIYDNSHTLGKNAIGVMVVADKEGFSPKHYRKFNIRFENKKLNLSRIDDYYMMKEVLTRRLSKLNSSENLPHPDIIIIDGGRGQYNVVEKIISKFNLSNINLISVSKGKERNVGREIIHLADKNINLKNNDPLLYFIQRLRDEAHRFAITSHRSKRSKTSLHSVFEDLSGIGPKRKKILMLYFGSIENIKTATLKELQQVKNVPTSVINKIYEFFHSQ